MDTVIGIKGKDFVICAADRSSATSIIRIADQQDKLYEIDGDKILACAGPDGDRCNFADYIQANIHLHRLRNQGRPMSLRAAANFTRTELAEALRKGPYRVDTLMAGYDKATSKAELYIIDNLGTLCPSNKAAHGYGAYFIYGLLDRDYSEDITLDQAKELIKRCIVEVQKRLVIANPAYLIKIVTKDGVERIDF